MFGLSTICIIIEMKMGAIEMALPLEFDYRFSRPIKEGLKKQCSKPYSYLASFSSYYPDPLKLHPPNTPKKWHTVFRGLDRTGLDWTGLVKRGLVKRGLVKRGLVKRGLVKRGLVKRGLVKRGLVKRGLVKRGLVKHGLVKMK